MIEYLPKGLFKIQVDSSILYGCLPNPESCQSSKNMINNSGLIVGDTSLSDLTKLEHRKIRKKHRMANFISLPYVKKTAHVF
jgi:hypothetical protein